MLSKTHYYGSKGAHVSNQKIRRGITFCKNTEKSEISPALPDRLERCKNIPLYIFWVAEAKPYSFSHQESRKMFGEFKELYISI